MGTLEQDIKVKISALVSGLKEVQKLQSELKGLEKAAGKKLSVNTTESERGLGRLNKLFSFFSGNVSSTTGQLEGLEKAAGISFGGITSGASLAAGAVAGLVAGLAAAYKALFDFVNKVAEAEGHIFDLSQQTGLSAVTISALKFSADESGGSIDNLTGYVSKFSKTVEEASRGSEEAKEKLKRLGIDPQEAIKDLDGALGKAFKTINDATPGVKQNGRAMDAFGKSGADIIPTIKSFNGDLGQLIGTATEFNAIISDEAAAAADRFQDNLHRLNVQLEGIKRQMAEQFMPTMLASMREFNYQLKNNEGLVARWGNTLKNVLASWNVIQAVVFRGTDNIVKQGVLNQATDLTDQLRDYFDRNKKQPKETPTEGGHVNSAADQAAQAAIRTAELDLKGAERINKEATAAAQREYDQRTIGLKEFTARQIKAEEDRLAAQLEVFAKEREAANKLTRPAAREKAVREVDEKENDAQSDSKLKVQGFKDEANKKEIESLRSHIEAQLALIDDYVHGAEASYRALADARVISFEDAEQKITAAQTDAFDTNLAALYAQERALFEAVGVVYDEAGNPVAGLENSAKVNLEAVTELQDKIAALISKQVAMQEDGDRRTEAGRRRDLDNQRQYNDELHRLEQENLQDALDIGNERIADLERMGAKRSEILKAQDQQDREAENARHQRALQDIDSQRAQLASLQATAEEIAAIKAKIDERELLEAQRHDDQLARIQNRGAERQLEKLRAAADRIGDALGRALQDGIEGGVKAGLSSALQSFKEWLLQLLMEALKAEVFKLLRNIFHLPTPGAGQGGQQQGTQGGGNGGGWLNSIKSIFVGLFQSHAQSTNSHVDGGSHATVDSVYKNAESTKTGLDALKEGSDNQVALLEAMLPQKPSFLSVIIGAVIQGVGAYAQARAAKSGGSGGDGGQAYADGGLIDGPGTSTSDSIPAWLSKGEFVMRAAAVKKLGTGALDFMNSWGRMPNMPRFADGGFVDSVLSNVSGPSTTNIGGETHHYNFKFDEPKDKKFKMPTRAAWRDAMRQLRGSKG